MLLPIRSLCAQDNHRARRSAIITDFIQAYSTQNFPALFAIFPEKLTDITAERKKEIEADIEKEYRKRFSELGAAHIDSISFEDESTASITLSYAKDEQEIEHMMMYFIGDTLVGLGMKGPDFHYTKQILPAGIDRAVLKAQQSKIDSIIKNKYVPDGFNGCVMVINDGKPFYKGCFGYERYDTKAPLSTSSVFELASCSKQFTAMAIMLLAQQGKLRYSDSVRKFIPDLPYSGITIEELLTHTSGLPAYMKEMSKHWDKQKFATNYDIMAVFKKDTPNVSFAPNEKFAYSNTGYVALSIIIEKASGMSFADFLRKNIFQPLKMNHSRVYNTRRSKGETIPHYAYGYVHSLGSEAYMLPDSISQYDFVRYLDAITGCGSVNSTIDDLRKWDEALRSNKLVGPEIMREAYSKHILASGKQSDYGYGVFLVDEPGKERLTYHSGGWPGYHTFILRFLDQPKSVIILSNNEYSEVSEMVDKIAKILVK